MTAPAPTQSRTFPLVRSVVEIDLSLLVAGAQLTLARRAYAHSPNGDRQSDVDRAEAEVNELLDARLALGNPAA
jgi:hypothetical protein